MRKQGRLKTLSCLGVLVLAISMLVGGITPYAVAENESAEPQSITFPLEETLTLTAYISVPSSYTTVMQTLNDNKVFQEMEKMTNIHLEFITTELSVLLASDSLPDMFFEFRDYPGGSEKAVQDGILVDLRDYMQYAPNYSAIMETYPEIARELVTDSGMITGLGTIQLGDEVPWYGLAVNKTLLDELGLEIPETIDEWYIALTAMKNAGVEYPLNPSGWSWNTGFNYGIFTGAYGTIYDFYNENGVAKYGPIEAAFKEFLVTMNKWYSEGLIHPDFITPDGNVKNAQVLSRQMGALPYTYNLGEISDLENGVEMVGAPYPSLVKGETVHLRNYNFHNKLIDSIAVSTVNEHIPETLAWADLAFSKEGYLLYNYGVEGESWEWEDGAPSVLEQTMMPAELASLDKHPVLNYPAVDPAYASYDETELKVLYTIHPTYGFLRTPYNHFNEDLVECAMVWAQASDDWCMPLISQTAAEANTNSAIMSDVQTFVDETVIQFILGTKDLSEFDDFVAQVKDMGIDTVIANKQAALDRYMAR